jgi:hypothetical protein
MWYLHVYVAKGRQHPTSRWLHSSKRRTGKRAPVRELIRARSTHEGTTHTLQTRGARAQGAVPRQATVGSISIVASRRGPPAWKNMQCQSANAMVLSRKEWMRE